ncbi:MAG: 2-oxo acid dehydrogenase subunit E2 [Caldilinea sp. CFX5]|nr:2-oxo acid dehydrogenase subunit E2 [Caldilinea sp. CFX5]
MSITVKMPQLGESIVEGTIARWLKAPGDSVAKYEPLLEISTDKIDTEVPAPAEGTLLSVVAQEGETVAVGAVLAYIGQPQEKPATSALPVNGGVQPSSAPATRPSAVRVTEPISQTSASSVTQSPKPSGRAFISPVVSRIAAQHQVDLDAVTGSGLGGRITKKDILAFVESRKTAPMQPIQRPSDQATKRPNDQTTLADDETLQPLSAMRRAIAQHMVLSKQTSPHVTTVFEVDMTAVVRHREANKARFAERGINLTFTPYFVAAVARALRETPEANSRFTPDGLILNRRIHIGVAVSLPDGLLVPVMRDADEKNLAGLARSVNDVAERARSGKLAPDEIRGGTFTITNHGITGSLMGTPIINQPQTGILGIGAISKRAVVRTASASLLPSADDAIVIRPMCYLSFSFDHRVLDGAKADLFLNTIRLSLEDWQNDSRD